ncbi:NTF2-related export protein [Temnothorax longispinosus]|uniref:NTF2-related export protein n=1 Tax=Temnothorax longispinosus TaxID=300112 RepID=A0A4S2L1I1_9HYME|nr:NTF2-related export protein [Temnothorax longispinosus]
MRVTKIDQACRTAEEFTKLYYESLDKRRYAKIIYKNSGRIYHLQNIVFILLMPSQLQVANQLTFLVKVGGQVRYDDKNSKPFNYGYE